jgi:hypothetical protein
MGFKDAYQRFSEDYPHYFQAINHFLSGRFDFHDRNMVEQEENFKDAMKEYYDEFKMDLEDGKLVSDIPVPWLSSVEYINEILDLRGEILNLLRDSIKLAINEGTIRSDVDPTELIALLMIIMNGLDNMPPDIKNMLEINCVSTEQFSEDIWNYVMRMIL